PAFTNIALTDTLVIASAPNDDRIYVGSRNGLVVTFANQPDAVATETFLDLRDRVAVVWDGGFLGLVFHPAFGDEESPFGGTFYVYYSSHCPLDVSGNAADLAACDDAYPRGSVDGFFNTYLRLSRFQVFGPGLAGDPSTEQVLINIRLHNDSHRGGGMAFRDDGNLYVTIGDQFRYDTAQDIIDTLEGGTLRLAVDVTEQEDGTWSCPPGSHLPRRTFDSADEVSGRYYCIPDDNPWLDADGGAFEEYCSIGHRNPHRLARDPVTDRLWSGEVGEATREEINLIECGNNYGWPFREGMIAGVRPEPDSFLGELTDPVIDFTREEARAVIGGYVYRGSKFPELVGDYLAGDYATNRIWAISLDEETMLATKVYLTDFTAGNLGTWGQDNRGEIYMGTVAGTEPLYTLARIDEEPVPDPPALLSQIGAFADLKGAVPSDVWLPYELNQPFWSDGAVKTRFIALPSDGERDSDDEKIEPSLTGNWKFPAGTVLMKHFELALDESDTTKTARLETRFLVLGVDDRWYGVTYRWLDDLSDAELLAADASADYGIREADGTVRQQSWYFPSRSDCLTCHREGSGGALGLRTHQLNRDVSYPGSMRVRSQLGVWNELGFFFEPLDEATISTMPASPALENVSASLEDRARSWLDSNCSYCHRPGEANAGFDARFTTPFAAQAYIWTGVRDDLGNPDTAVIYPGEPDLSAAWKRAAAIGPLAMPPLAKARAEDPAVDLLAEWIQRIDPVQLEPGLLYEYYEIAELTELPNFDTRTPQSVGTASTPDISLRESDDYFAFRFTGFVQVTTAGEYTFFTSSDDGSQLFVDGGLVVDNDGLHALSEESGQASLSAGYHSIAITMFEDTGGEILNVSWAGPDTADVKEPLGPSGLYHQPRNGPSNGSPVLVSPADQRSRRGDMVLLELEATDEDGDVLYFDAAGLPKGLSIDHGTGRISGTITEAGTTSVTASASDGPGVSVVRFNWVVDAG
ncbi:MAG TPA: PQQ-dependent sugar dehydrogenase, partial [Polyangiales bacterium]|nr:PQQ-dependent sugar dehydrogenase [Polyangiales bacterium]